MPGSYYSEPIKVDRGLGKYQRGGRGVKSSNRALNRRTKPNPKMAFRGNNQRKSPMPRGRVDRQYN